MADEPQRGSRRRTRLYALTDGRTAAPHISGQRKQLFHMNHLHRLRPDGLRALLQRKFFIHGNDKHIILSVSADSDQRLEHLLMRQAEPVCSGTAVCKFVTFIFLMRERNLHPLQNPHRICL